MKLRLPLVVLVLFFMSLAMAQEVLFEDNNPDNWLLRAFSIFGLVTILSGFTLYYLTSKKWFR